MTYKTNLDTLVLTVSVNDSGLIQKDSSLILKYLSFILLASIVSVKESSLILKNSSSTLKYSLLTLLTSTMSVKESSLTLKGSSLTLLETTCHYLTKSSAFKTSVCWSGFAITTYEHGILNPKIINSCLKTKNSHSHVGIEVIRGKVMFS